jgi:hypothetical protein
MITSSRACFQIRTLPPNKNTVRHSARKDFEQNRCTVPALSTGRGKNVKSPGENYRAYFRDQNPPVDILLIRATHNHTKKRYTGAN